MVYDVTYSLLILIEKLAFLRNSCNGLLYLNKQLQYLTK